MPLPRTSVPPPPAVVLLGSPRSGTTLLGHVFEVHPDVLYFNEPRLAWRYGNDRRSDALQVAHATPAVTAHIRSTFTTQMRQAHRTTMVEKTPSNSLRLPFVDAVLPSAKYIHITRDGREAVAAIYNKWCTKASGVTGSKERARLARRLAEARPRQIVHYVPELAGRLLHSQHPRPWGPRLPGLAEMTRDLPLIEVCALQWRWCVESLVRDAPTVGDRIMTVRLEDLTVDSVRAMHAHSGLPDSGLDVMLEQFRRRFDKSMINGRFAALTRAEQDTIERLIEPTMRLTGYV